MKKRAVTTLTAATLITAAAAVVVSSPGERSDLSLTVYNSNRALVTDRRNVELKAGTSTVRFTGIASQVIPQTVIVESSNGVSILEQNYEYDLISQQKLMEKYVGREVTIIQENQYTGKSETKTAKLLAMNGSPVFEIDGEIHLGMPGRVVLPELPENLYAQPTMNWIVNTPKSGTSELNATYMTRGITWNADYVLNLAEDDKSAALTGWVTLNNTAGTSFEKATLKLVAGDVNTVQDHNRGVRALEMQMDAMSGGYGSAPTPSQKEFFEYHLYTFPGKITVRDKQQKQLSLLNAANIKTEKKFIVNTPFYTYRSNQPKTDLPVQVNIDFKTGKKNKIDMPIPAGVIRLYKNDSDGSAVFLGEDRVDHTPINEEISLKMGEAFDIKADFRQTNYERVNDRTHRGSYEFEIRNHKKEAITVEVRATLSGDWTIEKGPEYRKLNAHLVAFDVTIPASGTKTINYTAKIKY